MLRKTTAIILIMILALSISSPAYAALPDESQTAPRSVEEILNDHHTKIFELENQPAASTYSRSTVTEESITQDTISELQNAGYEAYNVTASNYDTLEAELQTDFASMGLESDGSYIVVISGEDPSADNSVTPADTTLPPHIGGDEEGGSDYILYEDKIYYCRFVTVTAATNRYLVVASEYDLSYSPSVGDYILDSVGIVASVAVDEWTKFPISTVGSLITSFYNNLLAKPYTIIDPKAYTMNATSTWTRQFIQIWDSELGTWINAQSSAYVVSKVWLSTFCYDPTTEALEEVDDDEKYVTTYSPLYSNTLQRKSNAVIAYINGQCVHDFTGNINFYYIDGEALIGENREAKPLFTHAERILYYA